MSTKFAIVVPQPVLSQALPPEHDAGNLVVGSQTASEAPAATTSKTSLIDTVRGSSHFEGVSNVGGVLAKGVALAAPPSTLAWAASHLLRFSFYNSAEAAGFLAFCCGAGASAYGAYRYGTYDRIGAKYPTLSALRDIMLYVVAPAVAVGYAVGALTDTGPLGMLAGGVAGGVGVAAQDQIDRVQRRRAHTDGPSHG
jgi:hypothetical protein